MCKAPRQDSSHRIFLKQDMRRNVLPKFLEICMDLYGGRKPTETYAYATEVCYKSVNLSLGELKNIKITLFLIPELLR